MLASARVRRIKMALVSEPRQKSTPRGTNVGFRLQPDILDALDQLAVKMGMTRSSLLQLAAKRLLDSFNRPAK